MASRVNAKSIARGHGSDLYEGIAVEYLPFRRYLSSPNGSPSLHVYLDESARQFASNRFGETRSIIAPLGIFSVPLGSEERIGMRSQTLASKSFVFVSASHLN